MRLSPDVDRELREVLEARRRAERAGLDLRNLVVEVVARGVPQSAVAEAAGISRMTLHRWLASDVEEHGTGGPDAQTTKRENETRMGEFDEVELDKQTTHTKAETYLVVAQLNYRAGATRHSRPNLSKIRELYGELGADRARYIMAQTDRRIQQAAKRKAEGAW